MNPENPTDLAKAYDPTAIEEKWAAFWVENHLFDTPAPDGHCKPFTMLLPPPNVTGFLHLGHMFEHAESDILVRWHRMLGERALWVPGTDHAGIATQMLVERALAKEGITSRVELGREAFTARVWQWKQQYGGGIADQMKRLGASVDWSRGYFTMDTRLSAAVVEAFVRLHEQGLVYRGAYIVNWDPVLQTAVSDLEVENEERVGKLYHIRYPLADGSDSITIATTRPETLLGDSAVAVNPADARYQHLVGKLLALPLTDRQIPIVADDWAQPEFGTGAVKVTPAHDPNDFAIGQRHALPSLVILDTTAHIDLPGSKYHGLDRYAAREQIVADLSSLGLLLKIQDHPMTIPVSQRSGSVIEPRLSNQWFVKIQPLADKAIAAVRDGHIRIIPDQYEKTYNEWMGNIHDWCVSRQLWWGHRIPAWHCGNCLEITVARTAPEACRACTSTDLSQETDVLDTWFSSGLLPFSVFGWPEVQGVGRQGVGSREEGVEGSGAEKLSTSKLTTYNSRNPETPEAPLTPALYSLNPDFAFYPTDLLVTGFDILFFWVARMIMLGTHFMLDVPNADGTPRTLADAVPFRTVYIHGLIRDANREKMSKTKGNVVDPIDIIKRFGTDAVRFTLAAQASPGSDIAFSEDRTDGYRAFANKIWNAARFLFMNLDRATEAAIPLPLLSSTNPITLSSFGEAGGSASSAPPPPVPHSSQPHLDKWVTNTPSTLEDRWILSQLSETAAAMDRSLADYRFDEAASHIYRFFWGDLCDWYLELVKLRLNFDETSDKAATAAALHTLVTVYEAALRLLSPFMPFITEEIWHALYAKLGLATPARSIALTRYPQAADFLADASAQQEMTFLQELIVTIRGLRKEIGVPEKESTPILLFAQMTRFARLASDNANMLAKMTRVSSVELAPAPLTGEAVRSTADFDVQVVYERQIDIAAERERLTKDLAKYEKGLAAANKQLGNEAFMGKAPAHIVEGLRKQSGETQLLYDKTKAALDSLPRQ